VEASRGTIVRERDSRPVTDVVDLRRHRIRRAGEALRRAGRRTTPPPDAEADRWVLVFDVSNTEDGLPSSTPTWLPRKPCEDWQRARFGPCEPPNGDTDPAAG
jgi:hypothetical protein